MEYEDLIEDAAEAVETKPLDEAELGAVEKKPTSPWKAFVLTGLLASLIGAAGGGYGVYQGSKRITPNAADLPKTDLAPTDLAPLEAKLEKLTSRLSAAEASVTEVANRPLPEIEAPELVEVDLSGLEKRLDALEAAPSPEIDPAALTALQTAQDDGFEWPDTSDFETRLAALESQLETAKDIAVPDDISDRLEALETKIEAAQISEDGSENPEAGIAEEQLESFVARLEALEKRPEPSASLKRVSILAFPKDAMTAAVEDNQTGGFMKKTLSKHVRVKDEDAPLTLIDEIETDIAEGRLDDAAIKYDRLPEPVRDAGKAWYESVKASL